VIFTDDRLASHLSARRCQPQPYYIALNALQIRSSGCTDRVKVLGEISRLHRYELIF
jgi:hypothetical protein